MSLILDGTNGLSDVDGSASTPAIRGTDTNTGIFFPAADTIAFSEGGTESMRINSSANVGIGTTSPASKLQVVGQSGFGNGASNSAATISTSATGNDAVTLELATGSGSPFSISLFANGASPANAVYLNQRNNAPIVLNTNNTERMRIGGDGNIVQTSGIGIKYEGVSGGNFIAFKWNSPNVIARIDNVVDVTLANVSDYRIKRNIKTQTAPALEKVMALRPVTYQMANYGTLFKAGDDIKEGFIAHEVQEVIPSGTEGAKDDPNQIQSLRVDAILSVAVKAIQELKAIVDQQSTELDTVKAELQTMKDAA
jgi:hypothetical protein